MEERERLPFGSREGSKGTGALRAWCRGSVSKSKSWSVSPESLEVGLVVIPLASAGTGTAGGGRWPLPLPLPLPFMAEEDVDLRAICDTGAIMARYGLGRCYALLRLGRMASIRKSRGTRASCCFDFHMLTRKRHAMRPCRTIVKLKLSLRPKMPSSEG